jgi:hypothetical protein
MRTVALYLAGLAVVFTGAWLAGAAVRQPDAPPAPIHEMEHE